MKIKPYKSQYKRLFEEDANAANNTAPANTQVQTTVQSGDATNQQQVQQPANNNTQTQQSVQQPANNTTTEQPQNQQNANTQQQPAEQQSLADKYKQVNQEVLNVLANYIQTVQQLFSADALKQSAPTMVAEMSVQNSPLKQYVEEFSKNVKTFSEAKPDATQPDTLNTAITSLNTLIASVSNLMKANADAIAKASEQPQQTEGSATANEALNYVSTFRNRLYEKLYQTETEKYIKKIIQ